MRHLIGALALAALAGALSGCGHDMEQRAATGGVAGAAVGGPIGAVVGTTAGAVVDTASKGSSDQKTPPK